LKKWQEELEQPLKMAARLDFILRRIATMEQAELKDYSEASSLSIPITFESFEVAGDFGPVGMAKHQTGSLVDVLWFA
jgi:hypothetical protein